ncbi:hypothetical protein QN277_022957 [Acacia crassicarpa]|uniref:Uncharacterized protein n=1 Tax=Acacia crassicarpa TaxID=499986 RepID=A0AAE1JJ09_9FABA|nr:hypothetical protein QN277_022957 [Acacia crassicarpa]
MASSANSSTQLTSATTTSDNPNPNVTTTQLTHVTSPFPASVSLSSTTLPSHFFHQPQYRHCHPSPDLSSRPPSLMSSPSRLSYRHFLCLLRPPLRLSLTCTLLLLLIHFLASTRHYLRQLTRLKRRLFSAL